MNEAENEERKKIKEGNDVQLSKSVNRGVAGFLRHFAPSKSSNVLHCSFNSLRPADANFRLKHHLQVLIPALPSIMASHSQ